MNLGAHIWRECAGWKPALQSSLRSAGILPALAFLLLTGLTASAQFTVANPGYAADIHRRNNLKARWTFDDYTFLGRDRWGRNHLIQTGNVFNARSSPALVNALWITNSPSEDYLYMVSDGTPFETTNNVTIAMWVYPFETFGNNVFVDDEAPFTVSSISSVARWEQFTIFLDTNVVTVRIERPEGSPQAIMTRAATITKSNWNFVAFGYVKPGAFATPGPGVFAQINNEFFFTNIASFPRESDGQLLIGGATTRSSPAFGERTNKFQGLIDEVLFYTRAMRPEELRWLYANSNPRSIGNSETGLLFPASVENTNAWFVATNGSLGNDGLSLDSPKPIEWLWPSTTAATPTKHAEIEAGDTIWLTEGWYWGVWTNFVQGTADDYVTIRAYPGHRVVLHETNALDAILDNCGAYTRVWGLEFLSTNVNGYVHYDSNNVNFQLRVGGYSEQGRTNEVIHCHFHTVGNALGGFQAASNTLVYGCTFAYNGWHKYSSAEEADDGPGEGTAYSLYWRNDEPGSRVKTVRHSLLGPGFAFGVHSVGDGTTWNTDLTFHSNAFWLNGSTATNNYMYGSWLTRVGGHISNYNIIGNISYYPFTNGTAGAGTGFKFAEPGVTSNGVSLLFANNLAYGGAIGLSTWGWKTNVTITNNDFIAQGTLAFWGGVDNPPAHKSNYLRDRNRYVGYAPNQTIQFGYRTNHSGTTDVAMTFTTWTNTYFADTNSTFTTAAASANLSNYWLWPSEYESGRAHLFVINTFTNDEPIHDNIVVDVSGVFSDGTELDVINVIDDPGRTTPHAVLTVASDSITVPMTNLVAEPPIIVAQATGNPFTHARQATNGTVAGFILRRRD